MSEIWGTPAETRDISLTLAELETIRGYFVEGLRNSTNKAISRAIAGLLQNIEERRRLTKELISIAPLDKWSWVGYNKDPKTERCSECTHGYGFGSMLKAPFTCPIWQNERCPGWQAKKD